MASSEKSTYFADTILVKNRFRQGSVKQMVYLLFETNSMKNFQKQKHSRTNRYLPGSQNKIWCLVRRDQTLFWISLVSVFVFDLCAGDAGLCLLHTNANTQH